MATKKPTPAFMAQQGSGLNQDVFDSIIASGRTSVEPQKEPTGFIRTQGDRALALGQGVVGGVKMLSDLAGPDNAVSQTLGDANEAMQGLYSPARVAEMRSRQALIEEADAGGSTMNQITSRLGGLAEAPVQTTLQAFASMAPNIAAAFATGGVSAGPGLVALAARVGVPAALGIGMGVGSVKGQNYEAVFQEAKQSGMDDDQATALAIKASEYSAQNAPQQALGGALGALDSMTGAERLISGMARKGVTAQATKPAQGLLKRSAMGGLQEAPPEGFQGAQGQYAQNEALNNAGFATDPWQGVVGQGVNDAVVGAMVGAPVGAISNTAPKVQEVGPLSRAANAGIDAAGPVVAPPAPPPMAPEAVVSMDLAERAQAAKAAVAQARANWEMTRDEQDLAQLIESERLNKQVMLAQLQDEQQKQAQIDAAYAAQPVNDALARAGELNAPNAMQQAMMDAQAPIEQPSVAAATEAPPVEPRIVERTPDMKPMPLELAQLQVDMDGGEVVRTQNQNGKFAYHVIREAPKAKTEATAQPAPSTDILNKLGKPFTNLYAAKTEAARQGSDFEPVQVGKNAYVVRKVANGTTDPIQPDAANSAPVQPTDTAGTVGSGPVLESEPAAGPSQQEPVDLGVATGLPGGSADGAVNEPSPQALGALAPVEAPPVTQPAQPVTGKGAGEPQPTQVAALPSGTSSTAEGEAWTRMPQTDRAALAGRAIKSKLVADKIARTAWADIVPATRARIVAAMGRNEAATQEPVTAPAAAPGQGDGINDNIRALRSKSFKTVKQGGPQGDVRLSTGGEYVSFDDAVAEARKAVAGGVKAVPFQIHNALDVNIGDTDRIIAALNGPVAKPVTPQVEPVAPGAEPVKKLTPNQRIAKNLQDRADYFTPGNIVQGYSGHDRVISYRAPDGKGEGWNVTVQAVVKQDGQWVVDPKDSRVRTHSTMPDKKAMATGPIEKAAPAPVPTTPEQDVLPASWRAGINGETGRPVFNYNPESGAHWASVQNPIGNAFEIEYKKGQTVIATDEVTGTRNDVMRQIMSRVAELASPVATHQDPGKAPEVATAPVVAKSIAKAASNGDKTQKEMRLWLLAEIDKAVKLTEDYADYQQSIKDRGQDVSDSIYFGKNSSSVGLNTPQGKGTVTFDVPGDGKFKIRNSLRGLMEFRAKVEGKSGTGFTDKATRPKGLPPTTGVAKGSSNQIEALSNMLEELDFEAAVDYARETGVSLNDAKIAPHIRDQFKAYLKDGTLPPPPFSPTRYWEYQAASRADKDGNPIREASLTKEIGADTYVANVTGTNATGFAFTVTKNGDPFEKKSGTYRTFSDALQGAEEKVNDIKPEVIKPKDTGWNMSGTGYAGKRYIGRNITLDDGREVVARIYENAGRYEEAEVKVDGVRKFARTDRYKAEELADGFIRTLTAVNETQEKFEAEQAAKKAEPTENKTPVETEANDEPIPAVTEAQARKQFEWRNMGQKDGTKSHMLFFFESPADKGTGSAMRRGEVYLYQGASGWKLEDGDGTPYKALADAKAAAIDAAIPILQEQGYILKPAQAAAAILDAANITGKERVEAIKDVKKGDITPEELEAAYPAKEGAEKPAETDWMAELFSGNPAAQPTPDAQPAMNAPALRDTIKTLVTDLQAQRDDWASRTYKGNANRVNLQGDGPSNQESLSITALNEGRRTKALQAFDDQLKQLGKLDAQLETANGAKEFLDLVKATWEKARAFKPAGPGQLSGAPLFESLMIDALKLQPAQGSYTSLPITKALRAMMEKAAQKPAQADKPAKIEDSGQVLEGARKLYAKNYADKMNEGMGMDTAAVPLSKSWPEPDYQRLLDEGADPWAVAMAHAMRDEVPTKPSSSWKLRGWVQKVEGLREFASKVLAGDGAYNFQNVREKALSQSLAGWINKVDLYQAVGHAKSLKGITFSLSEYGMYGGQTFSPAKKLWTINQPSTSNSATWSNGNWGNDLAVADTKEEAIEKFKAWYAAQGESAPTEAKATSFDIYSYRSKPGVFIVGKRISSAKSVDLKEFPTVKEARAYITANQAELERLLAEAKFEPAERRQENAPRVGADHRNGADVTNEQFRETFGFRGDQFGVSMPQGERQSNMNQAYDALMDLAGVIGVPPKALSLNGELGLAFGARGTGGKNPAAAHYERDTTGEVTPNRVIINLTRKNGAGSLAHEWFHAVDNYFARMQGQKAGMMTDRIIQDDRVRPEMKAAFKQLMTAINMSGMKERSKSLDKKRVKDYWSTGLEMAARSFESYVIAKLQDKNGSNDYLANIVPESLYTMQANYPYPVMGEMPAIRTAFDDFFKTVETKETDTGVAMFSRGTSSTGLPLAQVNSIVAAIKARWGNAPDIVVATSMADVAIPQEVRDYDQQQKSLGATGEPEGFVYRGKVYLLADQLADPKAVMRVLFHESLGHLGLRGVFGDKLDGILKQLAALRRADVTAKADQYGLDMNIEADRMQAAEEVLAVMAQTKPDMGYVQRAIAAIRSWLRTNVPGFGGMKLTDADIIAQFIIPARKFIEGGNGPKGGKKAPASGTSSTPASLSRGDQTTGKAFKDWFKGSKVVDAAGKPLVVYHGSGEDFTSFDGSRLGENTGYGDAEVGFHFSDNNADADLYATMAATRLGNSKGVVRKFYLSLQNPLVIGLDESDGNAGDRTQDFLDDKNAAKEYAVANGNDGIVYLYGTNVDSGYTAIAFNPEQIKSATGNSGAFDPANPDIRFSRSLGASLTTGINNVRDVKLAAGISNVQDALKSATVTDLLKQFGNRLSDFRGLGLQVLGRRQLVDIYSKDLPDMVAYSDMVAQMEADKNEAGAEADKLATDWGKLSDERELAELMHDSTLAQIDPDKPFVKGDDQNFYDSLKEGFGRLTPDAQAAYRTARDMYAAHNDKVRKSIQDRIMRSELSPTKKQELLKRMDGEFFKKVKGVYFPLARFGSYVTIVKDSAGGVVSANRSETMNEAEATRKTLLRQFPLSGGFRVSKVLKNHEFNAVRDGVGRGFMADLFETLDRTGAGDELIDSISQLYLAALPDLSWAKHGIHRKGTPGFSQDARRAFAQNMFHGARYLAKLRYADQLQTKLDDMRTHIARQADNDDYDTPKAVDVVDEMVKRHESLMNPESNPLSTALTSLGFVFHLGLSPASALVNLSQTALVAYPIMGAKWGFGKASAALLAASRQAAGNKNDIGAVLSGDERKAYDEAVRRGVIDVTMAHDLAGISQGEDAKVSSALKPVMKYASFLFHHAEKFNRQVTFVASYRLARETGTDHATAFDEAVKATYEGHFDYGAANRPRLMQGNIARVVLLFKQYAQNMIYTLSRNAQQAIKAETPERRAEARKALSGLLVSHAMAAGVFGLPMVGMLLSVASMIGGDDDEPWDAKVALQNMLADWLGPKAAEVFAHGLSRLTSWDISGRVGLDKLLLPDVQEGLEGTRAAEAWATSALGPVVGIGVNMVKGMSEMSKGEYQRGLESMMPTALRGPLKSYRFGTEGNIDKTGVAINDEVSLSGVVGQVLGFSPSETRLAQEGKSAIYSADRAIQNRRTNLVRQFSLASMAADTEGMQDARKDIARFNEKNPKTRITQSNLVASVKARRKRINEAKQGVYLPSKRQDAMEAGRFAVVD